MNVGEKICLYKEKLGHKNFADFARAANCSGTWLNYISKKEEINDINDMSNPINLCKYLGITFDEFLKNDEDNITDFEKLDVIDSNNVEDIGVLINNMIVLLGRDGVKIDNVPMNEKSKEVCISALNVVKILVKQHL